MKNILVPTDFSKYSLNAIEYAVALAKKENAKIILLNTYHYSPPSSDIPLPTDIITLLRTESVNKLRELCDKISNNKKVKCEYLSQFNFAVTAILETAKDKKADMIIMGTQGASGIKKVLLGSIASSVIEKATCPVIAVPEKAKFRRLKNITYATDYNTSDIDALRKVVEIAKPFKAKITNLHASDEEFNRYTEKIYLNSYKNSVQQKIRYGNMQYRLAYGKNLPSVLDKHIKNTSPDLLVMSTRHRNLFEKMFGGSVTKKMAYHSQIPLLAFHHKKKSTIII